MLTICFANSDQMRKGELKELRLLEQVILDWDKAQKIKMFDASMEKILGQLNDIEKKQKIVKYNNSNASQLSTI